MQNTPNDSELSKNRNDSLNSPVKHLLSEAQRERFTSSLERAFSKQPFTMLVACEESQAISGEVRRFAKTFGLQEVVKAWSCDLLATSAPLDEERCVGPRYHLQGDALSLLAYDGRRDVERALESGAERESKELKSDVKSYQALFVEEGETAPETLREVLDTLRAREGKGWDMIVANPPCTYLAVSGARWYVDTDYLKAGRDKLDYHERFPMRRVERAQSMRLFMSIAFAPAKYIVIENPVGTLKANLEKGEYNDHKPPKGFLKRLASLESLSVEVIEALRSTTKGLEEFFDELLQAERREKKGLITLSDDERQRLVSALKDPKHLLFQENGSTELRKVLLKGGDDFHIALEALWSKKLPTWDVLNKKAPSDPRQPSLLWLTEAPKTSIKSDQLTLNFSTESSDEKAPLTPYPTVAQPYQFGDEASKKTCFWLKGINFPLKETIKVGEGERVKLSSGRSLPKWYSDALTKAKTTAERRTLRSKTFTGVARAVVYQWVVYAIVEEAKLRLPEKEKRALDELSLFVRFSYELLDIEQVFQRAEDHWMTLKAELSDGSRGNATQTDKLSSVEDTLHINRQTLIELKERCQSEDQDTIEELKELFSKEPPSDTKDSSKNNEPKEKTLQNKLNLLKKSIGELFKSIDDIKTAQEDER